MELCNVLSDELKLAQHDTRTLDTYIHQEAF